LLSVIEAQLRLTS